MPIQKSHLITWKQLKCLTGGQCEGRSHCNHLELGTPFNYCSDSSFAKSQGTIHYVYVKEYLNPPLPKSADDPLIIFVSSATLRDITLLLHRHTLFCPALPVFWEPSNQEGRCGDSGENTLGVTYVGHWRVTMAKDFGNMVVEYRGLQHCGAVHLRFGHFDARTCRIINFSCDKTCDEIRLLNFQYIGRGRSPPISASLQTSNTIDPGQDEPLPAALPDAVDNASIPSGRPKRPRTARPANSHECPETTEENRQADPPTHEHQPENRPPQPPPGQLQEPPQPLPASIRVISHKDPETMEDSLQAHPLTPERQPENGPPQPADLQLQDPAQPPAEPPRVISHKDPETIQENLQRHTLTHEHQPENGPPQPAGLQRQEPAQPPAEPPRVIAHKDPETMPVNLQTHTPTHEHQPENGPPQPADRQPQEPVHFAIKGEEEDSVEVVGVVAPQPGYHHFGVTQFNQGRQRILRLPRSSTITFRDLRRGIDGQLSLDHAFQEYEFSLGGFEIDAKQEKWLVKEYVMTESGADGSIDNPYRITIKPKNP